MVMTDRIKQYLELTRQMDDFGIDTREYADHMSKMDEVWHALTDDELAYVDMILIQENKDRQ
jgi:hypothetical protein